MLLTVSCMFWVSRMKMHSISGRYSRNKLYDYIFLSPHLDDVVLSCGGFVSQLTEAGLSVLVATLFAGDPLHGPLSKLARKAHELWGLGDQAMRVRRDEDSRACNELGADYIHLGLVDCIYRRHPRSGMPLYSTQDDVFGAIHPADLDSVFIDLSVALTTVPSAKQMFAPLGIGNHVDHQLLCMAVEEVMATTVSFYEDYPYCVRSTWSAPPQASAKLHHIPTPALERKLRAIRAYSSQLSSLFSTESNMISQVTVDLRAVGGERFWHRERACDD